MRSSVSFYVQIESVLRQRIRSGFEGPVERLIERLGLKICEARQAGMA